MSDSVSKGSKYWRGRAPSAPPLPVPTPIYDNVVLDTMPIADLVKWEGSSKALVAQKSEQAHVVISCPVPGIQHDVVDLSGEKQTIITQHLTPTNMSKAS